MRQEEFAERNRTWLADSRLEEHLSSGEPNRICDALSELARQCQFGNTMPEAWKILSKFSRYTKHQDPDVRTMMIRAFHDSGHPAGFSKVVEGLRDSDSHVKRDALQTLSSNPKYLEVALPIYLRMIFDEDEDTARYAHYKLSEIHRALTSPNPEDFHRTYPDSDLWRLNPELGLERLVPGRRMSEGKKVAIALFFGIPNPADCAKEVQAEIDSAVRNNPVLARFEYHPFFGLKKINQKKWDHFQNTMDKWVKKHRLDNAVRRAL